MICYSGWGTSRNVLWKWNFLFMEEITNDMKLRSGEAQRNKRWKDQFNLNKTKRTSGKTVWIEYRIEAKQAKRKKKGQTLWGEKGFWFVSPWWIMPFSSKACPKLTPSSGLLISPLSISHDTNSLENTSRKTHLHLKFGGGCLHRCYSHVNTSHSVRFLYISVSPISRLLRCTDCTSHPMISNCWTQAWIQL